MANLHRIHHGPVVHIIGTVEVDHLFHRTCINASQPADAFQEVPVGSWKVHGPLAGPWASA